MKNKIFLISTIIFFLFSFFIFFKSLDSHQSYSPKIIIGKKIPNFLAKDLFSNKEIKSENIFIDSDFYILNIWASWCLPCKKEHPILMNLSFNPSLKLIGLNYKDDLKNAKNFIRELGNPYSTILLDKEGLLGIEWGAYGVPETFLINKEKKIIKKYFGPLDHQSLKEIEEILK
tara:strand:- start:345 stop:866 length:522 start_codon:yes stop_codon:yes gene_type:complete